MDIYSSDRKLSELIGLTQNNSFLTSTMVLFDNDYEQHNSTFDAEIIDLFDSEFNQLNPSPMKEEYFNNNSINNFMTATLEHINCSDNNNNIGNDSNDNSNDENDWFNVISCSPTPKTMTTVSLTTKNLPPSDDKNNDENACFISTATESAFGLENGFEFLNTDRIDENKMTEHSYSLVKDEDIGDYNLDFDGDLDIGQEALFSQATFPNNILINNIYNNNNTNTTNNIIITRIKTSNITNTIGNKSNAEQYIAMSTSSATNNGTVLFEEDNDNDLNTEDDEKDITSKFSIGKLSPYVDVVNSDDSSQHHHQQQQNHHNYNFNNNDDQNGNEGLIFPIKAEPICGDDDEEEDMSEGNALLNETIQSLSSPIMAHSDKHHSSNINPLPPTPPLSGCCLNSDSECSVGVQSNPPSPRVELIEGRTSVKQEPSISTRAHSHSQPFFSNPIPSSGILVLSEEEKRTLLAEGYTLPTRLPLSKQEEKNLKKIRRKIKNKISAQESRRKKKEYLESLEKKVEQITQENNGLKKRVNILENNNRSLVIELQKLQNLARVMKSSSLSSSLTSSSASSLTSSSSTLTTITK